MIHAEDDLLTADEVAAMALTSRRTVNRWARDGHLPIAMQSPGERPRFRFRRSDVERILYPSGPPAAESERAS